MSDKPKPQDTDPEATVAMQRSSLTGPPPVDDDATVSIQRSSLTEAPPADDDATVMMSPLDAAQLKEAAAPAVAAPEFDPDATNIHVPPAPPPAPPAPVPAANMPWNAIAGGVVVLLVVLYFVFSGGKEAAPPAPKPEVAATPAAAEPAPAPSAPAAPAAEAAPAAPSAAAPAAPVAAAPAAPASAAPAAELKSLLAGEIKRGLVVLSEAGGATTITLRDAHQFDAGGADPETKLSATLLRVAAALDKVPGAIVVTGHADSSPSTDKRYPTNKELSVARAAAAAKLMAGKLRDPARLTSEGASDTQPLVPNDSTANRAKNRRVVIVLKPAA